MKQIKINCSQQIHVCFNYTQSAIDYFGLLALSLITRWGRLVHKQLEIDRYSEMFRKLQCRKDPPLSLPDSVQLIEDSERIKELDATIQHLQERIKKLETKHDERNKYKHHAHEPKRKVDKKQKGLLQQIFFENKELKRSSKELSSET